LAADQLVQRLAIAGAALDNGDRLLQADVRDVGHDLPELDLAALSRVHDRDLIDRDTDDGGSAMVDHAATSIWTTFAIPRKNSSDSNRNVSIDAPLNSESRNSGISMSRAGSRK